MTSPRPLRTAQPGTFLLSLSLFALTLIGIHHDSAHARDADSDKAGRVMLNVRGGPAFGIANADHDLRFMGALGVDLGVAVTDNYNAYLVFTPQLDFREGLYNVMVPLGFQYDIRLAKHVYLYPRMSLGYAAFISHASIDFGSLRFSASDVTHGGIAIAELGLKFVPLGRLNIGIEPLSIPIFFTGQDYAAWYRAMVFVGVNL